VQCNVASTNRFCGAPAVGGSLDILIWNVGYELQRVIAGRPAMRCLTRR